MNTVIDGLKLMKSLYADEVQRKSNAMRHIFSPEIVKVEVDKLIQRDQRVRNLFERLIKNASGENLVFNKEDSLLFKKVLGYCANYVSSLEKMTPYGEVEEHIDFNKMLKEKADLINNVFRELRQNKIV